MFSNVSINKSSRCENPAVPSLGRHLSAGSIPRELGRMTALQNLNMYQNKLTGDACTCGDASVIDLIVDIARVTAGFVQ